MDEAFAFCEQRVRERDRDRFLAALFAPIPQRSLLFALYAFDLETASLATRLREPLAGEVRLQWWREVVQGARAEEAQGNPLALALRKTLETGPLSAEPLLALIDARSIDLYPEPVATVREFEEHARHTVGVVLGLAARILGAIDPAATDHAVMHACLAIGYTEAIRRLPAEAARGRLSLPLELLRSRDAEPSDILAGRATPGLRAALADARAQAIRRFEMARRVVLTLPPSVRSAFLHVSLVPLMLRHAARSGDDPFRSQPELAPWRRQWTLWWASQRWLRSG